MVGYDGYYPFGLEIPSRSSSGETGLDNYKYTGHERDEETGINIDYMLARGYDPAVARFMQVDPLADMFPEWTSYHYVHNNPINMIDPTGMNAIAAHLEYDKEGNEYVVADPGDTIFDIVRFMVDNDISYVSVAGMIDENGYAIPGSRMATGRKQKVEAIYIGQGLPWWLDPGPGKLKAGARLTKSGAAWKALLAFVKGRQAKLTLGKLYHIIKRHGFNSGSKLKGKFNQDISGNLSKLENMLFETILRGSKSPNPHSRIGGSVYIYDFKKVIGVTNRGRSSTKIKVVVDKNGIIRTAYPI